VCGIREFSISNWFSEDQNQRLIEDKNGTGRMLGLHDETEMVAAAERVNKVAEALKVKALIFSKHFDRATGM
jgi:hypothetical protein